MIDAINKILFITFILILTWGLEFINSFFFQGTLYKYFGLIPREIESILNIPLAAFVHGNFEHLENNTKSLILFSLLILIKEEMTRFILITIGIIFISGFGIWIFGKEGIHIGASGLVYGYFGYLTTRAVYSSCTKHKALGAIGFAIGSVPMILGLLPLQEGISWEGHLCGLLSGVFLARCYFKNQLEAENI